MFPDDAALGLWAFGGADLYRSVLHAYATVRSSYDPNMVNSIIVISDGADDSASDLGEGEFLTQVRAMVTPSRPVIVVAVSLPGGATCGVGAGCLTPRNPGLRGRHPTDGGAETWMFRGVATVRGKSPSPQLCCVSHFCRHSM